ncbi:MAG: hypothetical protein K0R99_2568 [Microbacterium sp.]|nr:hypothetical protein [Microbacterium sp.]
MRESGYNRPPHASRSSASHTNSGMRRQPLVCIPYELGNAASRFHVSGDQVGFEVVFAVDANVWGSGDLAVPYPAQASQRRIANSVAERFRGCLVGLTHARHKVADGGLLLREVACRFEPVQ